jgi:hypothetical protein
LIFKAARAEIDHLDGRAALLPKKNILRLKITVDYTLLVHGLHALQDAVGESSHQMNAKALVVILLDQLVQIDSIITKKNCIKIHR